MGLFGGGLGEILDNVEKALGGDPDKVKKTVVVEKRKPSIFQPRPEGGTTYRDGKVYDSKGNVIPDVDQTGYGDPSARRIR